MPTTVLIAGGGPAALEAALRLRRVAAGRVTITLLTPEAEFAYRPRSVLDAFSGGGAVRHPLAGIAGDAGFRFTRGTLASVDPSAHVATTGAGEEIPYDVLLVAAGAARERALPGATVFTGSPRDVESLHGLVQDVEEGYTREIAFVVPEGPSRPLPLYELALMLAERAYDMCVDLEVHVVTPEAAPLAAFGPEPARELARRLADAGVIVHPGTRAERVAHGRVRLSTGEELAAARVITVPRLAGREIPGLPSGFLATDGHGRVLGVPDVYAAGDGTAPTTKDARLARRQAHAAADHIAARAGAPLHPEQFDPVLDGWPATARAPRFSRREPARSGRTPDRSADGRRDFREAPAMINLLKGRRDVAGPTTKEASRERFALPAGHR
jgi:sulfide:quinone oxidoreductase